MAQPKHRTSKSKTRMRRRSIKRALPTSCKCEECGADRQPHRVCIACGNYNGRQVLTISTDD